MKVFEKRKFYSLVCMTLLLMIGSARAEDIETPPALKADGPYCFQTIRQVVHVPTVGKFQCLQGGGSDGVYAYYAMTEGGEEVLLYKYDMDTWNCVAVSEPMKLGHGNDIAYDAKNHRLIVAYVEMNRVYLVDPDTLTALGFERTLLPVHRLEYLPKRNQVLIGSDYTLMIYQEDNWRKAESYFVCQGNRFVTQGLTSDGVYVYDIRWDYDTYAANIDDVVCNFVVIHDLNGNYIGDIPVYGLEGEPENIIYLGGDDFLIGCNGSDSIYLVRLFAEGTVSKSMN